MNSRGVSNYSISNRSKSIRFNTTPITITQSIRFIVNKQTIPLSGPDYINKKITSVGISYLVCYYRDSILAGKMPFSHTRSRDPVTHVVPSSAVLTDFKLHKRVD